MPFKSKAQQRKCYALKARGQNGSWDCGEFSEHTDFTKLPEKVEQQKAALATLLQAASQLDLARYTEKLAHSLGMPQLVDVAAWMRAGKTLPQALELGMPKQAHVKQAAAVILAGYGLQLHDQLGAKVAAAGQLASGTRASGEQLGGSGQPPHTAFSGLGNVNRKLGKMADFGLPGPAGHPALADPGLMGNGDLGFEPGGMAQPPSGGPMPSQIPMTQQMTLNGPRPEPQPSSPDYAQMQVDAGNLYNQRNGIDQVVPQLAPALSAPSSQVSVPPAVEAPPTNPLLAGFLRSPQRAMAQAPPAAMAPQALTWPPMAPPAPPTTPASHTQTAQQINEAIPIPRQPSHSQVAQQIDRDIPVPRSTGLPPGRPAPQPPAPVGGSHGSSAIGWESPRQGQLELGRLQQAQATQQAPPAGTQPQGDTGPEQTATAQQVAPRPDTGPEQAATAAQLAATSPGAAQAAPQAPPAAPPPAAAPTSSGGPTGGPRTDYFNRLIAKAQTGGNASEVRRLTSMRDAAPSARQLQGNTEWFGDSRSLADHQNRYQQLGQQAAIAARPHLNDGRNQQLASNSPAPVQQPGAMSPGLTSQINGSALPQSRTVPSIGLTNNTTQNGPGRQQYAAAHQAGPSPQRLEAAQPAMQPAVQTPVAKSDMVPWPQSKNWTPSTIPPLKSQQAAAPAVTGPTMPNGKSVYSPPAGGFGSRGFGAKQPGLSSHALRGLGA